MQSLQICLQSMDYVSVYAVYQHSVKDCSCETNPICQNLADSSFVPPLIYALMGSSRDIAIGPVAVVSLLLGAMLQTELDSATNAEEYRRLIFTATFFAGITQATLGVLR